MDKKNLIIKLFKSLRGEKNMDQFKVEFSERSLSDANSITFMAKTFVDVVYEIYFFCL
jgi:hypothetical protein